MPVQLSDTDEARLRGDGGAGVRMAMSILVRMAEVRQAEREEIISWASMGIMGPR